MPKENSGGVQIPADLSSLTPEELSSLEEAALAQFDELTNDPELDAAGLASATELADGVDRLRTETQVRADAAAELAANRDALMNRVHGGEGDGSDEGDSAGDDGASTEPAPAEPALVASARKKVDVRDVLKDKKNNLNIRLSEAAKNVKPENAPRRTESVLVAGADIKGFALGSTLATIDDLGKAMIAKARTLGDGAGALNYVPVAQLQRSYGATIGDRSSVEEVSAMIASVSNPDALIAAGGWCAPSEISYDFYNIVCEDGMIDLPTTGINRGGMRWPTSPSFGDLAGSTGLWHWNETQDIAAATGTAQSGSKTCARVPCAAFNEARLECDGICITAGNLTTDAWPEQIANFMRLVNAAHAHRVNLQVIQSLALNSTAVTGYAATGQGVATPILDAIEMQAEDIRTKYAMCDDAILEAVFPRWVNALIRADLAKRKGYTDANASFLITNAEIASWFTLRNIRVQLVQDWQVRGANQFGQVGALTAWPSTVQFMIYPAGTWLKGNGLSLDLGVIRDSTLNATNDYTAAWSEDCWLIARIGHESRLVTVPVCANGAVGGDITYACPAL